MPGPNTSDLLTAQFYQWEKRGRGWTVWPAPVELEPPFKSFDAHVVPRQSVKDDGRIETGLSRFGSRFGRLFGKTDEPSAPPPVDEDEEPAPELWNSENDLVELQTLLPAKLDIPREAFEQFLLSLSLCREPVAFEILGLPSQIGAQFVAHSRDAPLVSQQLAAYFPEAVFLPEKGVLEAAVSDAETAVAEFGLEREFMLRLASGKLDPFVGIIGALTGLKENELGLFQIIFRKAKQPWAQSIMRAVMDNNGDAFFSNAPELVSDAKKKIARPLYAAVVRIATQSRDYERAWEIARNLAGAFAAFADPAGNELIPLSNDEYPFPDHLEDVIRRQCRRSGMLLNSDELIGFVHLPGDVVRSSQLIRETKKTKAAPEQVLGSGGVLLGQNIHHGRTTDVRLGPEARVRHMHLVGVSGTGKSTLLFNLIRQDIESGAGVAVLDPHGDLVQDILAIIPPERIKDVVLVDPSDEEYPVGFNILSAHSDLEKTLLASDLISIFQRLSTSWGDQMGSVLQNAILAFLESSVGGTLADMRRFLVEPGYRAEFLKTVGDPDVVFYWKKTFLQLTGNRSIGPVLTRLETFLSPKSIRNMVTQQKNRLDFADILDTGKIFLAKLSQGLIGRENAFLLGSLMVAKFQQTAMARQRLAHEARRDFWLYIDEFHNFITPSMAEILTGARKYRLGLTLAHQELRQLQRDSEVAGAVLSNPYTRIVFRVGDEDARKLGEGFGYFEAADLKNLATFEAVARVERSAFDFNLTVSRQKPTDPGEAEATRQAVIEASRAEYATLRADVEKARASTRDADEPEPKAPKPPATAPTPKASATKPSAHPTPERKESLETKPDKATTTPGEVPSATDADLEDPEHKKIRTLVASEAKVLDYSVTTEWNVPGTQNRIDLVLERGKLRIACEINSTNTLDNEVGNLLKCLAAGFERAVMICASRRKLAHIRDRYEQSGATGNVAFFTPNEFILKLNDWALEDPSGAKVEREKPRPQSISLDASGRPEGERQRREKDMLRTLAEAMKRKK